MIEIKKAFAVVAILTAILYGVILYFMLFGMPSRGMVITSKDMLDNYNYWNSVNLIPFKTIIEYITDIGKTGSIRINAIRNLAGNLFLFFPLGFYLPFFVRKTRNLTIYGIVTAALIIAVEIIQLLTMTGSMDIDDFILNFAGVIISFIVFTRTPARALYKLNIWKNPAIPERKNNESEQ